MQPNNYPLDSSINQKNLQEAGSKLNLKEPKKADRLKSLKTIEENREDEDLVYEQIKNSRFK